jgi:hypothetical protein
MGKRTERCKDVVGKHVRLTREIVNGRGEKFPPGSHWNVYGTHRGHFQLEAANEKGETLYTPSRALVSAIRHVRRQDFQIEPNN